MVKSTTKISEGGHMMDDRRLLLRKQGWLVPYFWRAPHPEYMITQGPVRDTKDSWNHLAGFSCFYTPDWLLQVIGGIKVARFGLISSRIWFGYVLLCCKDCKTRLLSNMNGIFKCDSYNMFVRRAKLFFFSFLFFTCQPISPVGYLQRPGGRIL